MILELWMVGVVIAVLLFIRVPVGLAFIGPSLWYALADGNSSGFSLKTTFDGLNSFPLLAVPLFILVGVLANRLGIADRLYEFCLAALGRVRGNLAYVNIGSAVGFSWMSGSALADVAGLGKMQIPHMVKAGYPYGFAAGLTASSSLISPVMPPSIPAVIYAATATVSTGALFAASVIPAFLMAVGLCVYVFIWTARRPTWPRCRSTAGGSRRRRSAPSAPPSSRSSCSAASCRAPSPRPRRRRSPCCCMLVLGLIYRTADAAGAAAVAARDGRHHRRHRADPGCGGAAGPDPDPRARLAGRRRVPDVGVERAVGLHASWSTSSC